jgi:hypothetical protein
MTMPQEAVLLPVYGGCCFTTGKGFYKRLEGLVTKSQINDSKINLYDESFYSKTLRQVGGHRGAFTVGWRSSGRNHQCKWLEEISLRCILLAESCSLSYGVRAIGCPSRYSFHVSFRMSNMGSLHNFRRNLRTVLLLGVPTCIPDRCTPLLNCCRWTRC